MPTIRNTTSTKRERSRPTPSPLLLRRYTGAGGRHGTCAGVLELTKMDCNKNKLYKKLPVTLVYSKAFANIIQHNPNTVDSVFDFRISCDPTVSLPLCIRAQIDLQFCHDRIAFAFGNLRQ
jgi:hypothetical protein